VPGFRELHCPRSVLRQCTLTGTNLFLANSVASSADFDNAVDVKAGSAALTLSYLRVGVVGAGYTLDLRERELDFLVDANSPNGSRKNNTSLA